LLHCTAFARGLARHAPAPDHRHTGGTIDKIYFDDKSSFQIGAPQIGDILKALGVAFEFDVVALMRKDSLHMTDEDRDLIRRTIAAQPLVTCWSRTAPTRWSRPRACCRIEGKVDRAHRRAEPGALPGIGRVFNIGCAVGAAAVACRMASTLR
jgi:L-asparaginase